MNSCIIVLRPINNLGVTFMNMYHEYKIIHIYGNKMGGGVLKSQSCAPLFKSVNIKCSVVLIYCLSQIRLQFNA